MNISIFSAKKKVYFFTFSSQHSNDKILINYIIILKASFFKKV